MQNLVTIPSTVSLSQVVTLSLILFSIGALGVLTRKNIIVIFMAIEIMLNSVNLLFIAFSRAYGDMTGQVMVLLVMAVAAAEAAIGLAIVIVMYRNFHTVDVSKLSELKE